MGVVVAATHLELGERVAIKFLFPRSASDRRRSSASCARRAPPCASRASTSRASSTSGKLDDGAPYIVMEYLDGQRPRATCSTSAGRCSSARPSTYVLQACEALAEAHALGIVHRDLKPANLFLTQRRDGAPLVKVLDFGISKVARRRAPHDPSLTQTTVGPRLAALHVARADPEREERRRRAPTSGRSASSSTSCSRAQLPFDAETSGGLLVGDRCRRPAALADARPDVPATRSTPRPALPREEARTTASRASPSWRMRSSPSVLRTASCRSGASVASRTRRRRETSSAFPLRRRPGEWSGAERASTSALRRTRHGPPHLTCPRPAARSWRSSSPLSS